MIEPEHFRMDVRMDVRPEARRCALRRGHCRRRLIREAALATRGVDCGSDKEVSLSGQHCRVGIGRVGVHRNIDLAVRSAGNRAAIDVVANRSSGCAGDPPQINAVRDRRGARSGQ